MNMIQNIIDTNGVHVAFFTACPQARARSPSCGLASGLCSYGLTTMYGLENELQAAVLQSHAL
jgi:hypothetical protein